MSDTKEKIIEIKKKELNNDENSLVLKFQQPYTFEGQTHNDIDLSGLETLTGNDMTAVNKSLSKRGIMFVQEVQLEYAQEMAARVTGMPVEFFQGLSLKDSAKLKNLISNFMFGEE